MLDIVCPEKRCGKPAGSNGLMLAIRSCCTWKKDNQYTE